MRSINRHRRKHQRCRHHAGSHGWCFRLMQYRGRCYERGQSVCHTRALWHYSSRWTNETLFGRNTCRPTRG